MSSGPSHEGARLRGEAAGILAVKVVGTGLAFLAQLVLARRLGADGIGAYALAMAMLNALLVFSRVGFDVSSLRIATLLRADDDRAGLRGFFQVSRWLPAGAAAVLLALGSGVALTVVPPGTVRSSLLVTLVGLIPWTLLLVDQGRLRALGRHVAAFVPGEVVRPALLLAGILIAGASLSRAEDAPVAVAIHVTAIIVGAVVAAILVVRSLPVDVRRAEPRRDTRRWVRTSIGLAVVAGLMALLGQVDTLILGGLLSTADVGLFAIARRVAALLGFGLLAVNAAVAPGFARLHRDGQPSELGALTRRAARLSTAATVPLALVLLVAGRSILGWFGPDFPAAYPALMLFAGGQIVNAACGPVALLMSLTGYARDTAVVMAIALVALAIGCAFIAPRFGIVGAAAVSAAVLATWNLALVVLARIRMGIRVGLV